MNYYWHTSQGKVVQVAIRSSLAEVQASPLSLEYGFIASEARHRPGDVYVADGNLVEKPARPSPEHTWDYVAQAWADQRSLDEVKAAKWAQLKAQRDAKEFGPFEWGGHVFDGDRDSQSRIVGKVLAAKLAVDEDAGFTQMWKLADNSFVSLDAAAMIAVGKAMEANVTAAHETAAVLWTLLTAAPDRAAVDAVQWPSA